MRPAGKARGARISGIDMVGHLHRTRRLLLVAGASLLTAVLAGAWKAGYLPPRKPSTRSLRNNLAGSKSPYLRGAATQPVAWQPWGPEAFALARQLDRPVWLDIGAVWCHWCHVMDRESYENAEIAGLINQSFVPIKVDRDERPDIDARYQAANQALNGQGGGWPLTVFATSDGEPFASGTYFPPETRARMPGLRDIVPQVAQAYRERRNEVTELGRKVRDRLAAEHRASTAGVVSADLVSRVTQGIAAAFDPGYGGLGQSEGPKFPDAEAIRLAIDQAFLTGDQSLRTKALATLDAYARSGMRDHVAGGFFRYSTNRALTVPHFEKMDYVQSALLQTYLAAFRLTREIRYADVARDIMRYVNSTLSDHAHGGFYAHQDADVSLDDDGTYYTWSLAQVTAATRPELAQPLSLYYGIEPAGEMKDGGQNVPRIVHTIPVVAKALHIAEADAARRIQDGTQALEAARRMTHAPFVEQTKFTDRNSMMILAYLDAFETLGDEHARDVALQTTDLLLATAVAPDGRVWHATAGTRSYVEGLLPDYVMLSDALIEAFTVTGSRAYLLAAKRLMHRADDLLWDAQAGGFFDRPAGNSAVGLLAERTKPFTDTPLPGGNGVAARALDRLYLLTNEEEWRVLADNTLSAFAGAAADSGSSAATYAMAAATHVPKPPRIVVIGSRADERTRRLADAAWRTFRPGRTVTIHDPATASVDSLPPAVAGAARVFARDGTPRAYICIGETCAPPTTSSGPLAALVRDYGRNGVR